MAASTLGEESVGTIQRVNRYKYTKKKKKKKKKKVRVRAIAHPFQPIRVWVRSSSASFSPPLNPGTRKSASDILLPGTPQRRVECKADGKPPDKAVLAEEIR
jgi:hypothetical protein